VLFIPLATAWPELGFATLCRVKTKQRNRLLDVTLNVLINVSMNGPNRTVARKSSIKGFTFVQRLDILKIDKNSTDLQCFIFQFGVFGAFGGG